MFICLNVYCSNLAIMDVNIFVLQEREKGEMTNNNNYLNIINKNGIIRGETKFF